MKGFNKDDVGMFFGQYRKLLVNGGFVPTRIWNCDETWFTTVASEDDDEWPYLVCGEPFRRRRRVAMPCLRRAVQKTTTSGQALFAASHSEDDDEWPSLVCGEPFRR